jgi:Fe2+ transport system protein FeoA
MKNNLMALTALKQGQTGSVEEMRTRGPMRGRLMDLGLVPGTRVRRMQTAPAGSPIAFEIRGAKIALRKKDAADIFVRVTKWD